MNSQNINEKDKNAETQAGSAADAANDVKAPETQTPSDDAEVDTKAEAKADDTTLSRGEKKAVKKLEAKIAELERKLGDASEKLKESDDKYLRMLAEYDNFRRRAAKEKDGIYAEAYASAIGSLLSVLDNLDRAAGCTDPKGLSDGLALTVKSFNEALTKLGVEEIKAAGEKFDPNRHYAVLHVEDESVGENEIVEVLQKGYIKGDKVIRYAVVKVAN